MKELPVRKPTRLKEYDYSLPGAYFITVCVRERRELLGKIVGNGVYDIPQISLSKYGTVLDRYIRFMNEKYTHIKVDKYTIMPNHFHMILRITEQTGLSQAPNPTNNTVSQFVSLLKRYCNREYGENIWQTSFYDHIIRGEQDYKEILEYIENNPIQWSEDQFYQ